MVVSRGRDYSRLRLFSLKESTAVAKAAAKENQYDERRETLVMERRTTWPEGVAVADSERKRVIDALHRNPQNVKKLEYIRSPTGYIRNINVTTEDLALEKEQINGYG